MRTIPRFHLILIFVSLSFVCSPGFGTDPEFDQSSQKQPNFLFIIADDQAPFSIGAYGNQVCQTPNLDRIARDGIRLDGAYHMGGFSGAVCTNSRHMVMSGRTLWHIPKATTREAVLASQSTTKSKQKFDNPHVPAGLENNSLAAVFNRAGYQTMRTCKNGNSFPAANRQFQIVRDATKRQASTENGSAWHADQVIDYLNGRQQDKTEKPFLVYFGLSHPHDPRWANDKLLDKYGAVNRLELPAKPNPKSPSLPTNYLPAHPFPHGHPGLRDEVSVQGVKQNRDETTIRNEKGREYACIENIDQQVGRVLKKLNDMGELQHTYVIYTSDHGIAIGRHGLMGKQNLYEHTWRVPFLAMGPGIKPGSIAKGNVYLLDVLATLCDLADIKPPKTNEGLSMKSVLQGKADTVRDVLYGCYCGGTKPGMRSVRKGDWKLIKYETLDGKVKQTQLFNLAENPHELLKEHHATRVTQLTGNQPETLQINLADHPDFQQQRAEMEKLLLSEMVRLDDPYRFDEGFINPVRKRPKKNRNKKSSQQKNRK